MKRPVRIIAIISVLLALNTLPARGFTQNRIEPVAYDLKVKVEPAQGSLSVRAKLRIPPGYPESTNFNFWLQETFVIHKLSINGKTAAFSSVPGGRPPLNPASKNITVNVPPDVSAGGFLEVTQVATTIKHFAEDPHFSLFQGMAHEIAHFWRHFGSGQGDWINESFAEYFSAVALEMISRREEFEKTLKAFRREVDGLPADAPSLSTITFLNDEIGYIVRYYKGALMLDDLRRRLGDDPFFETCRDFYQSFWNRPIGTPEFREFWKKKLGDHGGKIDIWFDSTGGMLRLDR